MSIVMVPEDLEDALDHASDAFDGSPLTEIVSTRSLGLVKVKNLYRYDDISGWLEFDDGELLDMDPDERQVALKSFRGSAWARLACTWIARGRIPASNPIVIVDAGDLGTVIADGRGRVNVAIGMGWKTIPAVVARVQ